MKIKLLLILFSFLSISALPHQKSNRVLATVGDHGVTLSEFNNRYSKYLFTTGISDNMTVRKAILNNMINEILLYYYDSNDKIINSNEYNSELKETRRRTILAYLKDREVYSKITVTDKELRQAFKRVNEKLAARHLYAPTEEEANNLYELLKVGVDFNTLAKQVFTDSVLQNNGGYLGYFTWGDMDPAFEDVAYSLKVGEISHPVKTATGYSIIKLEDRIFNPLLTETEYLKKKPHLIQVLKMRKMQPSEEKYINSIFDTSKVSFNKDDIENILSRLNKKLEIESSNVKPLSDKCVIYKGKVYSGDEIEQKISDLSDSYKKIITSVESLQEAIKGILINEKLYKIAVSRGYDTSQVVLAKYEKYKMGIFMKYKKDEIVNNGYVSDSIVLKYYKDNIADFSTEPELNLQEILVDKEQLADSLSNLISEGYDFGGLAKEFSLRKWSAKNNGIMGYSPLSNFGSYGGLFWSSPVDSLIGPIKIENLYGIFKVIGKVEGKPKDFNAVKNDVVKAAKIENERTILDDYLDLLRKKVSVEINDSLLGSKEIAGL